MSWSEVAPRTFERAIGENELFIKLIGDSGHPLGREHWAINSIASFKPLGSLQNEDLSTLFLNAWKISRFHRPSIAVQAASDTTLIYKVPDAAALHQWATETFHVIENKTADELIPNVKPNSSATLTYLPNEIVGHTAHWRTDGVGVLLLIDQFFEVATNPTLPDPNTLMWGQETARLAPAIEEVADLPVTPTDAIKTLSHKYIETFNQAAGAVGIPYKRDITVPGGTRSSRLVFTPSETNLVASQCKAIGISVTSAVHDSVAAANYALASSEKKKQALHQHRSLQPPSLFTKTIFDSRVRERSLHDGLDENSPRVSLLDRKCQSLQRCIPQRPEYRFHQLASGVCAWLV